MPSEAGLWSKLDMPDGRYSLATEYAGYITPVWVARYCGLWLGCGHDERVAFSVITGHARDISEALRAEHEAAMARILANGTA